MKEVKLLCINSDNKPKEISEGQWVKKDSEYTVLRVTFHPHQNLQGVELVELSLEGNEVYSTYKLSRFAIREEDIDAFKELCEFWTSMNDLEVEKFIKELEVTN